MQKKKALVWGALLMLLVTSYVIWQRSLIFDFNRPPYNQCENFSIYMRAPFQTDVSAQIDLSHEDGAALLSLLQAHTYKKTHGFGYGDVRRIEVSMWGPGVYWPVTFTISDAGDVSIWDQDKWKRGSFYELAQSPKASKELYAQIHALIKDQLPPELQ